MITGRQIWKKTNFFTYKENVNAAYVNLNKQLNKKIGIQAGLRFENTNYQGNQYGNPSKQDSTFQKSYNSLFPTVYLSYSADKNNQFGFSHRPAENTTLENSKLFDVSHV